MNEPLTFKHEKIDRTTRMRAEHDGSQQVDLFLEVPRRDGGAFRVPLVEDIRPTEERAEGLQDNTLLSLCPVAEIHQKRPIKTGGLTVLGGRAVALLRPGYLYVFRGPSLWRELEIGPDGRMSEVDLAAARKDPARPRNAEGLWITDFLVPVALQGRFVLTDCRIAYSEVQWSWAYIERLESSKAEREKRTLSVAPAWGASEQDELTFDSGFPAEGVTSAPALRPRDLGIELLLDDPSTFTPVFRQPGRDELVARLNRRWQAIRPADASETDDTPDLTLETEQATDALVSLRQHQAVVCAAIPDPLFQFRHALAQLHLCLHYLDAIDLSLKDRPLIHSATLIRQALFDQRALASDGQIDTLRSAISQETLNRTLDQDERTWVGDVIGRHLDTLSQLITHGHYQAACADYRHHGDLGPCEAFALEADLLNLLQQLPGVLAAHGLRVPGKLARIQQKILAQNPLIAALASSADREPDPMLARLRELARDKGALTEERLRGVGLESLGTLAQRLSQEAGDGDEQGSDGNTKGGNPPVGTSQASTAMGLVENILAGWSAAVLKSLESLRKDDALGAIRLDRLFAAVGEAADLTDPGLGGELRVMHRGDVDLTRYSIVGVYGEGLDRGLTDADRRSEAMTRRRDYLYADRVDAHGNTVASTSPARIADETSEAIAKVAGHTWVFVLPIDHPEARKFSALKVDWANRARAIVDGPGVSRVLVALAMFNLGSEWSNLSNAKNTQDILLSGTKFMGAVADLSAAIMKLYVVTTANTKTRLTHAFMRPLFDLKSIPLVGPLLVSRLKNAGASSLVRTLGLVNFFAGVITVGVSAWDYRNSLSRGDQDATLGHGAAMVGGILFVVSPLLHGLLLVPGWGWAVLGLGALLGGSILAALTTDSVLERVLKQGPFGTGPASEGLPAEDSVYYAQLLSQFCPVQVSAVRFRDLSDEDKAPFNNSNPSPEDYVITVRSPLVSRFKLGRREHEGKDSQDPELGLGVQELEYTFSEMETANVGQVQDVQLTRKTSLERIKDWHPLPGSNAVRFLAERSLSGGESSTWNYREQRHIHLRAALQAQIETEIGKLRVPMPVLEAYEPYDTAKHGNPPDKQRHLLDPFKNEPVPYWSVHEVQV